MFYVVTSKKRNIFMILTLDKDLKDLQNRCIIQRKINVEVVTVRLSKIEYTWIENF